LVGAVSPKASPRSVPRPSTRRKKAQKAHRNRPSL